MAVKKDKPVEQGEIAADDSHATTVAQAERQPE